MSDKPDEREQYGVCAVPAYFIPGGDEAPVKEECLVVEEDMLTIDVQEIGWYTLMWTPTDSSREVVGFTRAQGRIGGYPRSGGPGVDCGLPVYRRPYSRPRRYRDHGSLLE